MPPPLPLFSPKTPPPPPWRHGPQTSPNPKTPPPNPPNADTPPKPPDRKHSKPLSAGVPGGRTRRAVLGIIRRVRSLEFSHPPIPSPNRTLTFHLPLEPQDQAELQAKAKALPWAAARDEELKVALRREKKVREPTRAERELGGGELERLRQAARGMGMWMRAKKAGITAEVVEAVRKEWRSGEIAAVLVVEPLRRCMDRAREILEIKTGGLVVWTKGDIHFVYRGSSYPESSKTPHHLVPEVKKVYPVKSSIPTSQSKYVSNSELLTNEYSEAKASQENAQDMDKLKDEESVKGTLYEREVNRLLDSLGPRFIDWWWNTPLPVDADLLPEVVPGFMTPFRQCPPGVRLKLADEDLTFLRKLARPLPTHFALGRNTKLQGLAAAILKLWEKSLIVKIAVKVGIQNTNNEQMAWEIKRLTGGTVILRNKDFIILYRGKDFLPGGAAQSIVEQEALVHDQQQKEEQARSEVIRSLQIIDESSSKTSAVGTFREYQDFQRNGARGTTSNSNEKIELEAEKHRLEKELKDQERKLFILTKKIERSNQVLSRLHGSWSPSEQSADQELLTEEEREIFRKIGLKMDEHVLLGRRGIFDGVIEEIRQHWKHKEVVKVITKQKQARQITYTAKLLKIETGGVLIAIEKLATSHAIILYRGKNYRRPAKLSPSNLLTKREALQRSIVVQRRGSLKYFARERQKSIKDLKKRLVNAHHTHI